jgi:hypothetical protein
MTISRTIIAATLVAGIGGAASAATLNYDLVFSGGPPGGTPYNEGAFTVDDARIVNGNCDSASSAPCLALNNNETSTVSLINGGMFSLTTFWFQLLGAGTKKEGTNTLLVETDLSGGALQLAANIFGHNDGGQIYSVAMNALFQNITWLRFSHQGGGNVRIDDVGLTLNVPAAVPIPAAGGLLLAAFGALGLLRRRRPQFA